MGRFSPTVLPNYGQVFADALGGAADTYLQSRALKRQNESAMLERGYMPYDPTTEAPPTPDHLVENPPAPTTVSGPDLAAALPGPMKGRPTPQQVAQPDFPQGQVAGPQLAAALEEHPHLPNSTPQPRDVPMHLLGRDWVMTPQAKAQMQLAMALKGAEIGQKNAESYKNQREAGQARPGDANYADVMGEVEAKKAAAQLPVEIQKMIAQGQISLRTGLALGAQRGQIEAGLQGNRQTFEQGQQQRAQTFQAGQTQATLAGQRANSIAEEQNKEQGTFFGPVARRIHGAAPLPPLPSGRGKANTVAADDPFGDLTP